MLSELQIERIEVVDRTQNSDVLLKIENPLAKESKHPKPKALNAESVDKTENIENALKGA